MSLQGSARLRVMVAAGHSVSQSMVEGGPLTCSGRARTTHSLFLELCQSNLPALRASQEVSPSAFPHKGTHRHSRHRDGNLRRRARRISTTLPGFLRPHGQVPSICRCLQQGAFPHPLNTLLPQPLGVDVAHRLATVRREFFCITNATLHFLE